MKIRETGRFLLFFCVGLCSWTLVNGLFVEIGYFIAASPEGTAISSVLSVAIQAGNILSVVLVVCSVFFSLPYRFIILTIMIAGVIVCIFAGFSWNWTVAMFGTEISLALVISSFLAGGIGSLSMVSLFPWVSITDPLMTSAISTGFGVTGLVATAIGLIQQATGFSVLAYFSILSGPLLLSFASFVGVVVLQITQIFPTESTWHSPENNISVIGLDSKESLPRDNGENNHETEQSTLSSYQEVTIVCCINQFSIAFMYFFDTAILPYTFSEYHNGDSLTSYCMMGGMITNSVGRFMPTFALARCYNITVLSILQVIPFIIITCCALFNQYSFQTWYSLRAVVVFSAWLIFSALNGYEDTMIYILIRRDIPTEYVEKCSRYSAFSNQIGAFAGSMLAFLFVIFGVLS